MENKTPLEQLNEAAEKYLKKLDEESGTIWTEDDEQIVKAFVNFALSPEAANGCNKHVEKAKIEFAIECIEDLKHELDDSNTPIANNFIKKLSEKLKSYE